MDFGSHGSTFGGNPLACTVGNAVLDVILERSFFEKINLVADQLKNGLEQINLDFPNVVDSIRGKGFILGIKCKVDNEEFVGVARKHNLLTVKASDNVVRLLPPINLSSSECEEALQKIRITCEEIEL